MVKKKNVENNLKQFYAANNDKNKTNWQVISDIKGISSKVSNELKKSGLSNFSVNKYNLEAILVNNKEKSILGEKSGIYEINCSDCDAIYIRQIGRSLNYRINEHKKSVLFSNRTTEFLEHCIDNNHLSSEKNVKLLVHTQKGKQMDLLEIMEIKKAIHQSRNVTNTQTDFGKTPIMDRI